MIFDSIEKKWRQSKCSKRPPLKRSESVTWMRLARFWSVIYERVNNSYLLSRTTSTVICSTLLHRKSPSPQISQLSHTGLLPRRWFSPIHLPWRFPAKQTLPIHVSSFLHISVANNKLLFSSTLIQYQSYNSCKQLKNTYLDMVERSPPFHGRWGVPVEHLGWTVPGPRILLSHL